MTLTQSSFALTAGDYLQRLQSCFSPAILEAVETLAEDLRSAWSALRHRRLRAGPQPAGVAGGRTGAWYRAVHEGASPVECCLADLDAYEGSTVMCNPAAQPQLAGAAPAEPC